jgi:hypothetical protein
VSKGFPEQALCLHGLVCCKHTAAEVSILQVCMLPSSSAIQDPDHQSKQLQLNLPLLSA